MFRRTGRSDRLTVERCVDGTVMPFSSDASLPQKHGLRMGVFDRHGQVVRQSLLFRSSAQIGHPAAYEAAGQVDPRTVIYGGHLSPHFGHFLLENLARLWFAREHPDWPIVWAARARNPAASVKPWQTQVLEVLGLPNEVLLLREPTRFGIVHVPQPGYRIKDFFAPQHAEFLAAYPARRRDPELRLWLSRAALRFEYRSIHARRLDDELAGHGWTVIHPERLPVAAQLELLATAGRVAGEQGSAFHLLALLKDVHGLQVDIICRRPDLSVEEQNPNYETIADVRGLQQHLYVVPEEQLIGIHTAHVKKLATTLAGHLEALGVEAYPASALPPAPALPPANSLVGLVNAVVTGVSARSYLEVGIGKGSLFAEVRVARRDVVRPGFASDPRQLRGDGLRLYEMPPDEFFTYLADRRYDVIVLDGFESLRQALAVFMATRRHAGPGTVWLVRGVDASARPLAVDAWWAATSSRWMSRSGATEGPLGADAVGTMLACLLPGLRLEVVSAGAGPCTLLLGDQARLDLPALRASLAIGGLAPH